MVLDLLIVVRLRPRFVVVPGTEGHPACDDVGFHLRGFAKGSIGAIAAPAIVGLVAQFGIAG